MVRALYHTRIYRAFVCSRCRGDDRCDRRHRTRRPRRADRKRASYRGRSVRPFHRLDRRTRRLLDVRDLSGHVRGYRRCDRLRIKQPRRCNGTSRSNAASCVFPREIPKDHRDRSFFGKIVCSRFDQRHLHRNGRAGARNLAARGASGLAGYTQGTVQGSITTVPGVDQDAFANAILRGGKIEDAVFDFDSVPVPQGLVAEPGGNVIGAQLFTTGIGSVTTTLAGFESEGQNALGGVIDQIPAVGTYPGSTEVEFFDSVPALDQGVSIRSLWATPDLRWRFAFASTAESEYLAYGDGTTFYPPEGGYGLALQSRGQFSTTGNIHFQLHPNDDLSVVALFGEANYDEYNTPFQGETYGYLNGATTVFPGVPNQDAFVDTPARVRGTYDVLKAQWVHTSKHSLARLQVYQSQFGSVSQGSWWDDDSYPDGQISLYARQGGREEGMSYDIDDVANAHHHFKYGLQYTTSNSFLNQVVPTADEFINSNPNIFTELLYAGDTWSMGDKLEVTGALRANFNYIVPSDGASYNVNDIDPHVAAAYRFDNNYAFRATFDHTTVAPKPLEADRTDSTNVGPDGQPAPFVPLAPETANNFTYSWRAAVKRSFG